MLSYLSNIGHSIGRGLTLFFNFLDACEAAFWDILQWLRDVLMIFVACLLLLVAVSSPFLLIAAYALGLTPPIQPIDPNTATYLIIFLLGLILLK